MKVPFKFVAGVLIAAGLVVAAAVLVMAGRPLLGLDLAAAATLVVGGFLLWALANAVNLLRLVRDELRRQRRGETPPWLREAPAPAAAEAAPATAAPVAPEALREQLGEQPMTAAEARGPEPEPAKAAAVEPEPTGSPAPEHELASLNELEASEAATTDQAAAQPEPEADVAPGLAEEPAEPPHEPPVPEPAEPVAARLAAELDENEEAAQPEPVDEAALYVVEERMFRGKPARVLSDGTIEAETDEGWMRFEDFDHLREYMDAAAAMRGR